MIRYINPLDFSSIGYDGKKFSKSSLKEKTYTVSRVLNDMVLVYSFKIKKDQSQTDISSLVEIKMYEEAGLDLNKEYKITYVLKELDFDEMNLVEAFAVEISDIKKLFENKIKKIKYIDFMALPFLSFSTLYRNKILIPKNDIFIYLDSKEAFISFYKQGSYISSKSLVNIEEIAQKLSLQGFTVDVDRLYTVLLQKGFDTSKYEQKESEFFNALESVFSDILTKINNIAMHNRSVFGFDRIDRIFFSTRKGRIRGLKEFILNFGFSDVEILDFNLFPDKQEDNFLDNIVASYGFDKFSLNYSSHNLTCYPRPAPFLSTRTGKLFLSVFVFVSVLICGYFYIDIDNKRLMDKEQSLRADYENIQKKVRKYKKEIVSKKSEFSKLENDIKRQSVVYRNIEASIEKLENLKNQDTSYVSFLSKVNRLLGKYNLKTESITQIERKKLIVEVISDYKNRDRISKFLKALIKSGFISVNTNEIKLDKNRYQSTIEITNE